LYASPHIVSVIKPGKMREAGHVARMGEMRIHRKLCRETRREEITRKT